MRTPLPILALALGAALLASPALAAAAAPVLVTAEEVHANMDLAGQMAHQAGDAWRSWGAACSASSSRA
jgi:hypothetical protein